MSADPLQFQLTEHDRRLGGLHKKLGEFQVRQVDQEKEIVGLQHDVSDARSDITKIEEAIEKSDAKREAGEEKTRKALYTVSVTFAGLALSLLGVIATFLGHA